MTERLQVIIFGCGNIAGGFDADRSRQSLPLSHAGAYTRHGGFELSACVEPDEERRARFMSRWSVGTGFADSGSIPAGSSFDVVSICSPTPLHTRHVGEALRLGPRLIFCEKPLTDSAASTAELVHRCAEAGVLLAVNHLRRWDPVVRRLQAELRDGSWGAVRSVVGHYNKGILNNGGHLIDLLGYLLGPLELRATGTILEDFRREDPTITAALVSHAGVPIYLNVADARDYSFFELEIITSSGVIRMEEGGARWRIRGVQDSATYSGYRIADQGEFREGGLLQAMTHAVCNIHEAIRAGDSLACTGTDALGAQRLCEAIRCNALDAQAMNPQAQRRGS